MEHVREIELVELAAGRVHAQREAAIFDHIRRCPQCREKLDGLRKTWDALGAWEVRPPERLATAQVPAVPEPEKGDLTRPVIRFFGVGMALRFAAAIVITAMAGYAGGRWSVRRTSAAGVEPPRYISALGLDVADDLSALVLQDDSLPATEGRV
jgi:anti-sigma factor RsiW